MLFSSELSLFCDYPTTEPQYHKNQFRMNQFNTVYNVKFHLPPIVNDRGSNTRVSHFLCFPSFMLIIHFSLPSLFFPSGKGNSISILFSAVFFHVEQR